MKNLYLLCALLLSASLSGQDYYWVGNSGNWSDLSHWATTSGGSEFHTELPGPDNDVYFDENSFTEPDQLVIMDSVETFCRDLNTTGVINNPKIQGVSYVDDLFIYGDLILTTEMDRDLKSVLMMNEEAANITTGEVRLGTSTFFRMAGGGNYHLMDSLSTPNLYVNNGNFHSNDYPVNVLSRVYGYQGAGTAIYMGTSNVYAKLWLIDEDTDLDMESATLYYGAPQNTFETFDGGAHHYHKVVFEGTVDIAFNNSFDIFEALPGASLNFEPGSVQTAGQFILSGTSEEIITMASLESGVQSTLSQMSGEVNAQYLVLSDNNASGGATFNAGESVDLGNNTGWNISISVPQDYYWVGGSGDWNDPAHWATSSGGTEYYDEPPTAIDAVYFDANSFSETGQGVNLGAGNVNCRDFSVDGVEDGVVFQQSSSGVLNVYGDLMVDQNADFNLYEIRMQSNSEAVMDANGNSLGNNAKVSLTGGGAYSLASDFNARDLFIEANNNFESAGYDLMLDFSFTVIYPFSGLIDLSNSYVETRLFQQSVDIDQIIVNNTVFYIKSSFAGYGMEQVTSLTLDGSNGSTIQVDGTFAIDNLTVLPGTTIEMQAANTVTLNNVSMAGTSEEPITITSSQPGTEAYFVKSSGDVTGTHLIISDNHASGGALFNAIDSELGANVEGWNASFTALPDLNAAAIKCYPNPVSNWLNIESPAGCDIEIYDLTGRIVFQTALSQPIGRVSVSHLKPGLYTLAVHTSDGQRVASKIIVNN